MQVFHLSNGNLESTWEIPFKNESELQDLLDKNLKSLFNLEFVKAQVAMEDLRIDTLAFDRNSSSFVIIEYKNNTNFSVVDQGITYLNVLLEHRADFVLLYQGITKKMTKIDDIDWSSTKVIIVSPEFNKFSTRAINSDIPVELFEVHKFSNDSVVVNRLETKRPSKTTSQPGKDIESPMLEKVTREIKLYSEDYHLNQTNAMVKEIYQKIRQAILALDSDVEIRPRKQYIGFISDTNFVDITLKRQDLIVCLNLKKGELQDPKNIMRDVSNIGHWGNGDYELKIDKKGTDLDYLMTLIKQSYEKNSR
jgi:predicted transport protein